MLLPGLTFKYDFGKSIATLKFSEVEVSEAEVSEAEVSEAEVSEAEVSEAEVSEVTIFMDSIEVWARTAGEKERPAI